MGTSAENKRYYAKNCERLLAQERENRAAFTPEERRAKSAGTRRWRERNPELARRRDREARRRRRAKSLKVEGYYTAEQWQARIDFYGRRCYLCGCDWDALPQRDQTMEHVIPLSRGGTNWPSNLRPACRTCNGEKFNKALRNLRVGRNISS